MMARRARRRLSCAKLPRTDRTRRAVRAAHAARFGASVRPLLKREKGRRREGGEKTFHAPVAAVQLNPRVHVVAGERVHVALENGRRRGFAPVARGDDVRAEHGLVPPARGGRYGRRARELCGLGFGVVVVLRELTLVREVAVLKMDERSDADADAAEVDARELREDGGRARWGGGGGASFWWGWCGGWVSRCRRRLRTPWYMYPSSGRQGSG